MVCWKDGKPKKIKSCPIIAPLGAQVHRWYTTSCWEVWRRVNDCMHELWSRRIWLTPHRKHWVAAMLGLFAAAPTARIGPLRHQNHSKPDSGPSARNHSAEWAQTPVPAPRTYQQSCCCQTKIIFYINNWHDKLSTNTEKHSHIKIFIMC